MQAAEYITALPPYPDHPRPSSKPTFAQLINRHCLTSARLAHATQIALAEIQMMVRGKPVLPIVAEAVLAGVERLTGYHYAITDVDLALCPHWSYQ